MPQPPRSSDRHIPLSSDMFDSLCRAFLEERLSLNAFLEERHSKLISQLQGDEKDAPNILQQKRIEAEGVNGNGCASPEKCVLSAADGSVHPAVVKRSKSVALSCSVDEPPNLQDVEFSSEEELKPNGQTGECSPGQCLTASPSLITFKEVGETKSFDTMTMVDRDMAIRRLQARMGYMAPGHRVTPAVIHQALQTLSLNDIEEDDILYFVVKVKEVTERDDDDANVKKKNSIEWKKTSGSMLEFDLRSSRTVTIAFSTLVDVLMATPESLIEDYGAATAEDIKTYKDILLQSDASCVVAELMCLRVDDISAPVEPATFLELMEPVVGVVIMLNGVLIGFQTEDTYSSSGSMIYIESAFTVFFLVELFIKLHINGVRLHFTGEDILWNWFDFLVVVLAVVDTAISLLPLSNDVDTNTLTVFRLARLTRLTRLVRIFRLQCLEELTLMVKGLLGGLRTLCWAVVLLFFILYVIGIFLTLMVGADTGGKSQQTWDHERDVHFSTLPKSMFTTFRCLLIVDCVSTQGTPLLTEMTSEYGWLVPFGYTVCFVVVSIGLMNLIMAIYIENTLNNAKQADDRSKIARSRESFRVARQLKKLLVMLCSAQKAHHRYSGQELVALIGEMPHDHDAQDLSIQISRETFMLCLQHPIVQRILDDLDLPPERAHLFDQLDADCSGHLLPTELVNGLLKVRGETRRGDVVATLLAVRSLQNEVKQIRSMLATHRGSSASHISASSHARLHSNPANGTSSPATGMSSHTNAA